jgi:hypothetical protein
MNWWQLSLTAWAIVGAIVFFAVHYLGRKEPTDHGQIVIGQFAIIGCCFWPFVLLYLPFAGLWSLGIWLFGRADHDPEPNPDRSAS